MSGQTQQQWRPARSQKGVFWTPSGRGSLVKDTVRQAWFFSVGRGNCEGGADRWGPLGASFEDEAAAASDAIKLERQLGLKAAAHRMQSFCATSPRINSGWSP